MSAVVGVDDIKPLVKGLKELKPILQQLSNITRIVWLIQAPGPRLVIKRLSQPFSAKIPEYNKRVRTILKSVYIIIYKCDNFINNFRCILHRGSGVVIWDSNVPLGMEYSRSCAHNYRLNAYINHDCRDEIHHGKN